MSSFEEYLAQGSEASSANHYDAYTEADTERGHCDVHTEDKTW